jgi:hypothetical protein
MTYVFIPEAGDIEAAVDTALQPFDYELQVKPRKRYLDQSEIDRMATYYGIGPTAVERLAAKMADWNGGRGGSDAGGLFTFETTNPDGMWDWYEIGGRWDGHLPGNVAGAKGLLRSQKLAEFLPHDFLTPDGEWHQSETYILGGPDGVRIERKSPAAWLEEFQAALKTYAGDRVVNVDVHS